MAVDSTDLNLRLQYWWVSHKLELRRWWVLSLLILDGVLLLAAGFFVTTTALGSRKVDEAILAGAVRLDRPLNVTERPQPVSVDGAWDIAGTGTTDFVAQLTNPNTEWLAAAVEVEFSVSGDPIPETVSAFLLPGETRHVFLKRNSASADEHTVAAKVVGLTWEHPEDLFPAENTAFAVSGVIVEPLQLITGAGGEATRVTADVRNASLYGFWAVDVNILLYRNGAPVAFSKQTIRTFESSATETVAAQWLRSFGAGVQVIVEPYVNVFDESTILPVG
jgi:hypothetical protein